MQNITVTPVLIADSADKEWTLEITRPNENKDRHICISIKDVSSISLVEWYLWGCHYFCRWSGLIL